ncbi:c-type cytochrome [Afifella sp. YEN Y35]|uniref:c-type cytochrome n=1 Tax=Afifella sp. YEN Y35 TaxID=3388337 RepID=UPI0039DFBC13
MIKGLGVILASLAAVSNALADGATPFDPETVAAGKQIYGDYCASCHGEAGEGTENWQKPDENGNLLPPPHNAQGHTWRHPDGVLYQMVLKGWRDPFNGTPDLTMPPFEGVLEPDEIHAVLTYIKTLWTADQRALQAEESAARPFPDAAQPFP